MHDLLMVLRTFSVADPATGRRELRPGTIVNMESSLADWAVREKLARRLVEPAPLFVDSERPRGKPKKGNDATLLERPRQPPGSEAVPRDERPDR